MNSFIRKGINYQIKNRNTNKRSNSNIMNRINIIINGKPQVGKDTFVNFIKNNFNKYIIDNISSVDFIKNWLLDMNIDVINKPNNVRQLIVNIKHAFYNYNNNFIIDNICSDIYKKYCNYCNSSDGIYNNIITFIHCREQYEIDKFKSNLNAKTLLIKRESLDNITYNNQADDNIFDYNYDYIFNNNYDNLIDYEINAIKFFHDTFLK